MQGNPGDYHGAPSAELNHEQLAPATHGAFTGGGGGTSSLAKYRSPLFRTC